jgi:integrase
MARQPTGAVIEHVANDGKTYRSLRFSAYGKRRYVSLGPVSATEAAAKLRHALSDVERKIWQPPAPVAGPAEPEPVPTFHQYAEQWWLRAKLQLAAKTRTDYRWRLERHLIPAFGDLRLDAITLDTVENYIAGKLAEGERIREAADRGKPLQGKVTDSLERTRMRTLQPLSPRAINMTVTLLAAILESALERELIARNPAKGRGRRVTEHKPARSYLAGAAQIESLLDAAGELDREATKERAHLDRRATLATMIYAGLRIGEVCSLRWRDVDLGGGWLAIAESKTDAGVRKVKIRGALRDELLAVRSRRDVDQDAYVFPTRTGRRQYEAKVRTATLGGAVKRANARLAKRGLQALPAGLTPHSLRRTFATILYALGEVPPVVMAEMGHTSPALALRIYAQAERLSVDEREQLAALVAGSEGGGEVVSIGARRASNWQTNGRRGENGTAKHSEGLPGEH